MSILVLGLGNILLQDEGIGVHVIEALEAGYDVPPGVTVVDGGTAGMDMLNTIAGFKHMIVADAVKTGAPAGTVVVLKGDQVPAFFKGKLSPHQVGLSDLLAVMSLTDEQPETIALIGCVPFGMETSLDMTPGMHERLPQMLELVLAELAALGASAVKKAG
jgi:hydrogenase maturation protease